MLTESISMEDAVLELTKADEVPNEAAKTPPDTQGDGDAAETTETELEGSTEPLNVSEGQSNPDDAATELETVNQGGEEEQEAVQPSIEAPTFWQAESKQAWGNIPDDVKPIIEAELKRAEAHTTKVQMEAADKLRQAEAKLAEVGESQSYAEEVTQTLKAAQSRFDSKWDYSEADWAQFAQADPSGYVQLRAEFEADREALTKVHSLEKQESAKAEQARIAQEREYLQKEAEKVKDLIPEWTDPVKGPAVKQKLAKTLATAGFSSEQIRLASAQELQFVHKAMLWDEAQASLQKTKNPVPPKAAPAASKTAATSPNAPKALREKFKKTGSMDDAVALLMAGGAAV